MSEQRFVQYNDQRMPVPDGMTLEQMKEQMARYFPDLAEPKVETKKEADATVYVFSKQAGRKGAGPNGDIPQGQWGIVELMGHKVVAGLLAKEEMLGKAMLRVDVPETSAFPAFTQLYGDSAIYCVTFVSEEVARRTAQQCKVNPVSVYVPTLVTMEEFEKAKSEAQAEINRLRGRLPNPTPRADAQNDDDEPDYGDLPIQMRR